MTRRWLTTAGLLATLWLLADTGPARAQHWLAYYPGGVVDWYFGPYPFVYPWPNTHWPSANSYFTYGVGEGTYKVYYPTTDPNGKYYFSTPKAGIPYEETTARIEVKVPTADADIWFEGVRTTRGGTTRLFRSPPLAAGRNYKYDVLALWNQDGREVTQKKTISVRAGDRVGVDFDAESDKEIERIPAPKKPGL